MNNSDIEAYKKKASVAYKLLNTLKKLKLVDPLVGFHGRHREDNIIKAWQYGKKYGKK